MKSHLLVCFVFICSLVIKGQKTTIDSLADFDYTHFNEHLSQIKDKTEKENFLNLVQRNFIKRKYNLIKESEIFSAKTSTSSCSNVDLEDGNINGWSIIGDYQIMSGSGTDPYGGFPVVCPGNSFSLRLNDDNTSCAGPNAKVNFKASASNIIAVTSSNATVKINFAGCVLAFPHPQNAAAFARIEFYDQLNNLIAAPNYSVLYASPPNSVIATNPTTNYYSSILGPQICSAVGSYSVVYFPWQTQIFNLSAYIGQNVKIKLIADWCLYNYDWGYAYFDVCCDASCPTIGGASNTSTVTNTMCVKGPFSSQLCTSNPSNINFQWSNFSGPISTASCLPVSALGTYSLVSNPSSNPTFTVNEIFTFALPPTLSFSLSTNFACSNNSSSVPLFASPSGGTFSGLGVTSSGFDPWLVVNGIYTIVYTYTDPSTGCSASSTQTIMVATCTGIKENGKHKDLVIAPNPFNTEILIGGKDLPENSEFILFNCLGQEILRKKLSDAKNTIDTEGIPYGLYIYSIEHQNKPIKQGKLVKD